MTNEIIIGKRRAIDLQLFYVSFSLHSVLTRLVAQLGGRVDEVGGDGKADDQQTGPGNQALRSELVGLAGLGPRVRGVNGGVPVDVGAVLVLELVNAHTLALAALGILPVLALHGVRHAHKVLLDGGISNLVQALLLQVNLLAGGHHLGVDGVAAA
eukprot:CAMPEP_0177787994 /NCGR_PEP_ID=MMETSP0491_2-20121128/21842_1 /TAXON_ID=63592 /ORGANISM="Tetraselmis chuii, Strain PLY429" /LENGTH=155 /DNA_ID=CAMNT_0019309487 /DNA_START=1140 /DNA_END=1603 /DNA_ORIENTATION=+